MHLKKKRRVKIEHVVKEVKTFKTVSQVWRHPRWLMPICVELATLLAKRRLRRAKMYICITVSLNFVLHFSFPFNLCETE